MTTKCKLVCGTLGVLVVAGTILLALPPNDVTLKYRPQLIEHPDESFKLVDSKITRQSEVSFVCDRSFRCRMNLYTDRVLSTLKIRQPRYRLSGTSDLLWLTYRSEKLARASVAQPFFKDERDKTVFPTSFNSGYDIKTGTGVLVVSLPTSRTNRSAWKLHLNIPPDGKGFLGGKYAVFKL